MKKKRILFINTFFSVGGIQSSMINMVNELSKEYDVDVFLYNPEGKLRDRLSPEVSVLPTTVFFKSLALSYKEALKTGNIVLIILKFLFGVWTKLIDNRLPILIATKTIRKMKGYDLAVAFRPETRRNLTVSGFARVLNRCVEAKKKAVWIHFDILKLNNDNQFNKKYYGGIDKIVCVSESVMKAFESVNPDLSDKMDYCYNIFDYKSIIRKSNEKQDVPYPENKFICFSASRLSTGKGIVRAISAMAPTMKEHTDVVWYIAGDGPERENIETSIKSFGLENRIILLGSQANPYNYMKNADLYISTSFHEAAPMVYMEAKALHVPVFTTRTLSSDEMLKDGVEDFICENSEEGIREKFAELMDNRQIIFRAKSALDSFIGNNDNSLQKIADWLI